MMDQRNFAAHCRDRQTMWNILNRTCIRSIECRQHEQGMHLDYRHIELGLIFKITVKIDKSFDLPAERAAQLVASSPSQILQ